MESKKPAHDWVAIAAQWEAVGELENANRVREMIRTSESHPSKLVREAASRMLSAPRFFTEDQRKALCEWEASQKGGFQQGVWPTKLGSS